MLLTALFLLFSFSSSFVLAADTLDIVSKKSDGTLGNAASSGFIAGGGGGGALSYDGRYAVFTSVATNLVDSDTNGVADIFFHDRQTGTTELISIDSNEQQANAASSFGSMSYDGRYVVFYSTATNLVSGDTNGVGDIFLRDRQSGTTERVSVDSAGVQADAASVNNPLKISGDGKYVSFSSDATNLVAGDNNSARDVFLRNLETDTTERIGESPFETVFGISSDGQFILLVDGSTPQPVVYDHINDITYTLPTSAGYPVLSGDGQYVAYRTTDGCSVAILCLFVINIDDLTPELIGPSDIQASGLSSDPQISYDGRYVGFWSDQTNIVPGYTGVTPDIYIYDRDLDTVNIVSKNPNGSFSTGPSRYGNISADGHSFIFESGVTNLVSGDTNGVSDTFAYTMNSLPTDIMLSSSSINENENVNTAVGTLTTTDSDASDIHTYSLACTSPGTNDSSFIISGATLRTNAEFDYEEKSSYSICIRTSDGFDTYDKNFLITINDISESGGGGSSSAAASTTTNTDDNPPPPPPPPPPEETKEDIPPPPDEPTEQKLDDEPVTVEEAPTENTQPQAPALSASTESEVKNIAKEKFSEQAKKVAGAFAQSVKEMPKKTADTISAAGVAVPAIVAVITQPAVAANVVSIPIRLWNLVPIWLGFRRRKRPWGTVYDSVTKQPLDPVYVSLKDLNGREIASTITDLDGRFGFLVPPGRYKISAKKDNYEFPSQKLFGKDSDELYGNLYFETEIQIEGVEDLVIRNIPMDSTSFNWNEFEKANNKRLMKFYSKRELFLARIANILFWIGLVISVGLLFGNPTKLNYILFGVYALVFVLRSLGIKPKKPGYVTEASTGFPLSFGIVRIFSKALNQEVAHAIIGKTGKYYVLVSNGEYYAKIERKIGEDKYEQVFMSEPFKVKKGFIGRNFGI